MNPLFNWRKVLTMAHQAGEADTRALVTLNRSLLKDICALRDQPKTYLDC
jgi:hypothetical protein